MSDREAIKELAEKYNREKPCCWCIHADLGDGACKECNNKSLWNKEWQKGAKHE